MEILRIIFQALSLMFSGFVLGTLVGYRMEEKNSERKNKISYDHAKEVLDYAVSSNKEWQTSFENINEEWVERYTSLHNEYIKLRESCIKKCGGCTKNVGIKTDDVETAINKEIK